MRFLLIFIFIFTALMCRGQGKPSTPVLKAEGTTARDFTPEGWKVIDSAAGDLNKDGLADLAIIIEDTDGQYLLPHDGLGGTVMNVNPRLLLVLFRQPGGGYKPVAKNQSFIPPPNDTVSPCLADPLSETEGLEINNGVLALHFQYWMSCGSWYTSIHDYLFRYQHGQFELIGFNSSEFHRASGAMSDYSINFSTKKLSHTEGGNMFEETENKPKTTWKKIQSTKMMNLESMDNTAFDEILNIIDQK